MTVTTDNGALVVDNDNTLQRELLSIVGDMRGLNQTSMAERVLETVEAAPEAYPNIYASLQWDNDRAARLYRIQQCRQLIMRIRFSAEDETAPGSRAVVYLRETGNYETVPNIIEQADLRTILARQALADLESWRKRTANLLELAGVHQAIDATRRDLGMATREELIQHAAP